MNLYELIIKIVIYMVLPHYVLVSLVSYVYKPRLAHMIYRFREEIMQRNKLAKTY